jgi:serine/threonine-protein kinase
VVGNGTCGYSGDGLPATLAQIMDITGLAVAPNGTLFLLHGTGVARVLRTVGPDGKVRTIAGHGSNYTAPQAEQLRFCVPSGIAFGHPGRVYVAENETYGGCAINRIRSVGVTMPG